MFDRAKLAVREAKLAEESVTGLADCRSCSRSCETISVNRDIAGFAERIAVVPHRNRMFRRKSCELQVSPQDLCQAVCFFAGILIQRRTGCRSCTDVSSVASFVEKLDFASFAQSFAVILTTPATGLAKSHYCVSPQ